MVDMLSMTAVHCLDWRRMFGSSKSITLDVQKTTNMIGMREADDLTSKCFSKSVWTGCHAPRSRLNQRAGNEVAHISLNSAAT